MTPARILRPMYVLAVADLERSAAFYRDALGFTIREIGDPGWRMFERDACRILAGHCPGSIPAGELGDHSYFANLVVDDVDALFAEVRAHPVQLLKHVRTEPWGMREFGLRTVDGHRIMVGQDLTAAGRDAAS